VPRTLSDDQVEQLHRIRDECYQRGDGFSKIGDDLNEVLGEGSESTSQPSRDAEAWRQDPASEAQLYTLRKAGVSFRPDITKGMASDLIEQLKKRG